MWLYSSNEYENESIYIYIYGTFVCSNENKILLLFIKHGKIIRKFECNIYGLMIIWVITF
jgi:hypothetical protein